jgi:hypothetical protein
MVSGDQMRHFVSSQVHALRHFAGSRPGPDRFGFAWAPNNATEMPYREFVAQSGQLLDRLGVALADSGGEWRIEPGLQACASLGSHWCVADVEGASFTDAWRIFAAWDTLIARAEQLRRRLIERVRGLVRRETPSRSRPSGRDLRAPRA